MAIVEPIQFPELRAPTAVNPFGEALSTALNTYFGSKGQMANIAEKQASAERQKALASLPFGGANVPGPAGQIVGLEMIRRQYGEGSPQFQMAQRAFDLSQQADLSRIGYQNALTGSMGTRYLTPTGKSIVEEANVRGGASPSGSAVGAPLGMSGNPYNPAESGDELGDQYSLLRQKQTTDVDTRKRNLFATNIEKTLSMINPEHLTQYAGYQGGLKQKVQQGLAGLGKESTNYDNYKNARQAVDFLTSQVRQFYGDSIQPAMLERLNRLSDPSEWTNNPRLAKELFNTTKNILQKEMQTYRQAVKSRRPYEGGNDAGADNDPFQGQRPPADTVWMISPKGQKIAVHLSQIPSAKARGLREVG